MGDAVTYAIELAVGVACLLAALGIRRRSGIGVAVVLLGIAGLAAVADAIARLV